MMNYRLRGLLSFVHGSELAPYATALDPRLTYWPEVQDRLFRGVVFGAGAEQTNGSVANLTFSGSVNNLTSNSNLYNRWSVTINDSSTLTIKQLVNPGTIISVNYTLTNGSTDLISLPNSYLQISLANFTPGCSWLVTSLSRPSTSLVDVLNSCKRLGDLSDVFGSPAQPPYDTFQSLYIKALTLPLQLGALILAMGWKIDSINSTGM
jgi:hypothetical protein